MRSLYLKYPKIDVRNEIAGDFTGSPSHTILRQAATTMRVTCACLRHLNASQHAQFHFFEKRTCLNMPKSLKAPLGGVAEWSIAAVLKTVEPLRVPGVRIPLPPLERLTSMMSVFFFPHSRVTIHARNNASGDIRFFSSRQRQLA